MLASSFKGFEPMQHIRSISDVPQTELSLASIAVSLKRIADYMDRDEREAREKFAKNTGQS